MKTLTTCIGAFVLACYVLAWLDVIDFYLCIGKLGACLQPVDAKPMSRRAT